jgi:hypothetical protein
MNNQNQGKPKLACGLGEHRPEMYGERWLGEVYVAEGRDTFLALVPDRYKPAKKLAEKQNP